MEAPEMFRVLGKRRPEYVIPYLAQLQRLSQTDDNDVVRIHCMGAVKATEAEIYNDDEDIHDPCLSVTASLPEEVRSALIHMYGECTD
jgi:hypothetical protein